VVEIARCNRLCDCTNHHRLDIERDNKIDLPAGLDCVAEDESSVFLESVA
jgi:hypothetical protein